MDYSKFYAKIRESPESSLDEIPQKCFSTIFPLQKYSMLDKPEIKIDLNGEHSRKAFSLNFSTIPSKSKSAVSLVQTSKNLLKPEKIVKKKSLIRKQGNIANPPRRSNFVPLPRVATLQRPVPKKPEMNLGAIPKTISTKPTKLLNVAVNRSSNVKPTENLLSPERLPKKMSPQKTSKSMGSMRNIVRPEDKSQKFSKSADLIQITDLADTTTAKSVRKPLSNVQIAKSPAAKNLKPSQKPKKQLEPSQKSPKQAKLLKGSEQKTVKTNKIKTNAQQSNEPKNKNYRQSPKLSMKSIDLEERKIIRVETKIKPPKKIESIPIKSEINDTLAKPLQKSEDIIQEKNSPVMKSVKNELPKILPLENIQDEEKKNTNVELSNKGDRSSLPYIIAKSTDFADDTKVRILFGHYYTQVLRAFNKRKIFTIYGDYFTLRKALVQRGWLEKLLPTRLPHLQALPDDKLILSARPGNVEETVVMSKIINSFPAFFVWQPKELKDVYAEVCPIRNRIRRSQQLDFTTKLGLIGCARNQFSTNNCGMSYPRFYRLDGGTEDRSGFITDYRHTQCRCLIYFLWNCLDTIDAYVDADNGIVSPNILKFALNSIDSQLSVSKQSNDDFDTGEEISYEDWNDFIIMSNKIIDQKAKLKMTVHEVTRALRKGTITLDKICRCHPDFNWDGDLNIWLLKPGYKSRGIGIVVKKNLDDILEYAAKNVDRNYVVQKYVERPMLIYKTKFDVRAYMLQTIAEDELSIWLYQDCYMRFSSQEYSLNSLRASIHLTNNSVQRLYKNSRNRDGRLPLKNMWSLLDFKNYLIRESDNSTSWDNTIYVGFAQNLISVVMASLESTKLIANSFELYGCDFMLDSTMLPILIEINSTPDMTSSTEVTAAICPKVLNDVIKVVVDYPNNHLTNTGFFQLIFKVPCKTEKKSKKSENAQFLEPPQIPFDFTASMNSNFSLSKTEALIKLQ